MTVCTASAAKPASRLGRVQLLTNSAALRTALRRALAPAGGTLSPSGSADDPPDAFFRPDAVVLDTSLPGLDGLDLLRQIFASNPAVPIIVVAPDTVEWRSLRAEAMRGGAKGFVLRPETERPLVLRSVAEEILALLDPARPRPNALSIPATSLPQPGRDNARHESVSQTHSREAEDRDGDTGEHQDGPPVRRARRQHIPPQVIVVASSTGGPQALIDIFKGVSPATMAVPVLVVQHMPPAFTPILADHLSRSTTWRATEATSEEPLTAGEIRIAPGGHHMIVAGSGVDRRLRLTNDPPVNFCRPAADVLFTSAASSFGRAVLAVILTGMGNDGCEGAKVITAAGGAVIAQDRETSVVWGMPGAAVTAGIVDKVVSLAAMPDVMRAAMKGVM